MQIAPDEFYKPLEPLNTYLICVGGKHEGELNSIIILSLLKQSGGNVSV